MSDGSEAKQGRSFFWLVYGQIAAMLGAFSILVFVTHFVDVGLKGIIAQAFEGWVQYVRPAVGLPLQWIIDLLPPAWRIEVPDVAKDYAAVGLVNVLSFVRAHRAYGEPITFATRDDVVGLLFLLAFWPVMMGLTVAMALDFLVGRREPYLQRFVMWIAPLIYLGLLFAANAWLL